MSVLFSIVIPTYNRAHIISATIESVFSQSYNNFEILIVDDGSTDNTEEVVQQYSSEKVRYFKKRNGERGAARNFGTQQAKGDYINWLDSDDIMFLDHLRQALNIISKYNNPEIFAMGHQYQYPSGEVMRRVSFTSDVNDIMYIGNPMANSPVMVRRDVALANPFNEDRELSGSEDYELWLRIAAKFPVHTSPEITIAIIYHNERSVLTMGDPDQLITRYTKFINYTIANPSIIKLLGKNKEVFVMKNYLLLAVDLVIKKHLGLGRKYLSIAFKTSSSIVFERGLLAFAKYYIRYSFF